VAKAASPLPASAFFDKAREGILEALRLYPVVFEKCEPVFIFCTSIVVQAQGQVPDHRRPCVARYYHRRSGTSTKALLALKQCQSSDGRPALLYMIIERFKNRDPIPVYRRFRDYGRLAPEGLQYVSSWVDEGLERCFQLMETGDRKLLDEWISNWSDIVEFEIYPVISSKEAAEKVAPYL
jgi:Protein of unknown function (DUF3303)